MENIQHGIEAIRCQNVSVHGNRQPFNATRSPHSQIVNGFGITTTGAGRSPTSAYFAAARPTLRVESPRVPLGSSDKVDPRPGSHNQRLLTGRHLRHSDQQQL